MKEIVSTDRGLKATANCHSAISVVNALATGFGSAIGIGLGCSVTASFVDSGSEKNAIKGVFRDKYHLVDECIERTIRYLKYDQRTKNNLAISIESDIPQAVGLKSSSAISVATVRAVSEILGAHLDEREVLKISCVASMKSGVSITGAFDDACACLIGGLVITNNRKFELIKHSPVPRSLGSKVLIRVPDGKLRFTGSIDVKRTYARYKAECMKAFEFAMENEIYLAMMLNSIVQCSALGYRFEMIADAVKEGASAVGVSGKGPAVAAICRSEKIAEKVKKAWFDHRAGIITTKIVQPSTS